MIIDLTKNHGITNTCDTRDTLTYQNARNNHNTMERINNDSSDGSDKMTTVLNIHAHGSTDKQAFQKARSCDFRGFAALANAAPNNASCLVRAMAPAQADNRKP